MELKNSINKDKLTNTKKLLVKKNEFDTNKFIIIKKGYNYYDNIYHYLISKNLAKKVIKNNNNKIVETLDWKKSVYPKDLFAEDDSNLTKAHKREYFRKICSRYELDKDIKLMYIGNDPENHKLNLRIPYEYEKLKILNELHKRTGHTGYHRLYDAVKDNKYF